MLNDLYLNIVYKDDPLSSISTRIEFNELLTVENLQFYADFNGVNLIELVNQFRLYEEVTNYGELLQHMDVIGNAIVDELKSKFGQCKRPLVKILNFLHRYSETKVPGHLPPTASHFREHKENLERCSHNADRNV